MNHTVTPPNSAIHTGAGSGSIAGTTVTAIPAHSTRCDAWAGPSPHPAAGPSRRESTHRPA